MTTLSRFSFALLLAGMLTLAACNAEPEQPEAVEDAIEDQEGPIEEELQQELGLYDTWDSDADTYLSEDEFATNYDQNGYYGTYDTDADTYLSEDEYNTGYVGAGFDTAENFGTYDTDSDGRISQDEFRTGLFNLMDADGDGRVSREEFQQYESMMSGTTTPDM